MLRFWHLALVFIHANRVSCSWNTTKQNTMSRTQCREGRPRAGPSQGSALPEGPQGCLESFCSPKDGGELAEHTGASSEGLSWCCSFISTCVKCRGRALASPFVLTFLQSLLPASPTPSLVLYHPLLSTGILAHPYVWRFFFPCFLSLLYWLIFFFFKKCNLSFSEMPVLVKPLRTEALPPLPSVLHYL